MIKSHTRPRLPVRDLLDPTDDQAIARTYHMEITSNGRDRRFEGSRKRAYEATIKKERQASS